MKALRALDESALQFRVEALRGGGSAAERGGEERRRQACFHALSLGAETSDHALARPAGEVVGTAELLGSRAIETP